jgi:hypothetical protein
MTGTDELFDPGFLDIPAVNLTLDNGDGERGGGFGS